MAGQWALLGNLIITVAYAAVAYAIAVPLVQARQVTTNRLALATAMIFFSCAVGHAFHAAGYVHSTVTAPAAGGHHTDPWLSWPSALWDVFTAAVGVYYWTLRRGYGVLLGRGALYVDPHEQQRRHDIELREKVAEGRAEAEAERDAQAAMLRAIIDNSQSVIYVKDLDGRYLMANDAFLRSMGVTEADVLGRTDDALDPVLAPVWREHDLRARAGAFEVEEYSETPDGRHVFESVKFPLYDATGQLYATCGVSLDVTRLRRAMADAERARDEALAQSQVKSDFLATMSHEIRTPMNGVLGLSSLLLGTDLDAAQHRYATGIHTAGNALLGVINDILDFSKIEAGRLELDIGDVAVATVLDEVAALVAPTAAAKGLDLRVRRDANLPPVVRGDGGRLRQVLLNLAGNAVKFTGTGSVTVCADVVGRAGEAPVLRFSVVDTGIGIAADTVERLFEPFTQADASTTRTYGGTGLGLTISRRLVEAMGGTLGVDSVPGQGSTFWCVIPFGAGPGDPAEDASPVAGLRVLLVQPGDGPGSPEENLRRWRISPTRTGDAATAVRALREAADRGRPYDVLIVDADAGVDPASLAAAVTADPPVHVVVFGADAPAGTPAAGTPAARLTYLPKPVHRSHLFDLLATVMTRGGGAPSRPAPPQDDTPPDGTVQHGPVLERAGREEAGREEAGQQAGAAPQGGGAARILLVEDNEINQLVAVGLLKRLGHECDVASDGEQALQFAARRDYDVILMDCRMPRMDGFTATAELRRREGDARHTPVVAMTASALAADRDRCLAAGMDDYLAKPVASDELGEVLRRWLAPPPRAVEAAPQGDPLLHRLAELAGDRTAEELALVAELITSFLERVPRHLAALGEAVAAADAAAVEDRAHSLAGAAGNIGAAAVADLCHRLEQRGRDGDLTGVRDELRTLHAEVQQVDRRLRSILAGGREPAAPGAAQPEAARV